MILFNSSLNEFNELDRTSVNISADINNSKQNIKTLDNQLSALNTSAEYLQQSLQDMKDLYTIVDDASLQKELLDLKNLSKRNIERGACFKARLRSFQKSPFTDSPHKNIALVTACQNSSKNTLKFIEKCHPYKNLAK